MKIMHVVRSDSFAGTERHIANLANAQARSGDQVWVVGGDPRGMNSILRDVGVPVLPGATVRQVMAQVRRLPKIDIVHAHMTAGELSAALATTSPLVTTRHFAQPRGASTGGRIASQLIKRRVCAQIAVSQFVARNVDGASTVVYAGVPHQEDAEASRNKSVLIAQRLAPEKRTADAIHAFAESGLADEGWRLEVAGRGAEREALVGLSERVGLREHIHFLGFCEDLSSRIRHAAVLMATAPAEPFGLTVIEAMSHGTPVVAAAGGGHLESVGQASAACLYDPADARAAGEILARLGASISERTAYGQRLQEVQRRLFTPDRQLAATRRVYAKVLTS